MLDFNVSPKTVSRIFTANDLFTLSHCFLFFSLLITGTVVSYRENQRCFYFGSAHGKKRGKTIEEGQREEEQREEGRGKSRRAIIRILKVVKIIFMKLG